MLLSLPREIRDVIVSLLASGRTLRHPLPSRSETIVISHHLPIAVQCSCKQMYRELVELWKRKLVISISSDEAHLAFTLDAFAGMGYQRAARTVQISLRQGPATASPGDCVQLIVSATAALATLPNLRSFCITVNQRVHDSMCPSAMRNARWPSGITLAGPRTFLDRWEGCMVVAWDVALRGEPASRVAFGRVRVLH